MLLSLLSDDGVLAASQRQLSRLPHTWMKQRNGESSANTALNGEAYFPTFRQMEF